MRARTGLLVGSLVTAALGGYYGAPFALPGADQRAAAPRPHLARALPRSSRACGACHTPFRGVSNEACLRCHEAALAAAEDSHPAEQVPRPAQRRPRRRPRRARLRHLPPRARARSHPRGRRHAPRRLLRGLPPGHRPRAAEPRAPSPSTGAPRGVPPLPRQPRALRGLPRPAPPRARGAPAPRVAAARCRPQGPARAHRRRVGRAAARRAPTAASSARGTGSAHARSRRRLRGLPRRARRRDRDDGMERPARPRRLRALPRRTRSAASSAASTGCARPPASRRSRRAMARAADAARGARRAASAASPATPRTPTTPARPRWTPASAATTTGTAAPTRLDAPLRSGSASSRARPRPAPASPARPATCPAASTAPRGADVVRVDHDQNDNLRPRDKMLRSACLACHGLGFAIDALADEELSRATSTAGPRSTSGAWRWPSGAAPREGRDAMSARGRSIVAGARRLDRRRRGLQAGARRTRSITPQKLADALHAVMAADRAVYAREVVERLQDQENVIRASEHYRDDKALPLPAQMFRMGAEAARRERDGRSPMRCCRRGQSTSRTRRAPRPRRRGSARGGDGAGLLRRGVARRGSAISPRSTPTGQ